MPARGDGPIEVAPLSPDPDIGLVHPPGPGLPIRDLSVPPGLLVQLRSIFLDPAVDGAVIDRYAAFGHHFFQIAVAEPVAAVPPDRPQDDFTGEMTTGEDAHGCDYFTQVFLSPELCNSTTWDMIAANFATKELKTSNDLAHFRTEIKKSIAEISSLWPEAGIEANTDGVTVTRTAPSVQQKPPRPELD